MTRFTAGALSSGAERVAQVARKTDKLPNSSETNAARQVIRVSQTSRVGDRELVRVRPFVRVAPNLSLTVSELSASVPKFNPARLMMDNGGVAPREQREGPAGANHIHRLPEAVEDQHRLIKHGLHNGAST